MKKTLVTLTVTMLGVSMFAQGTLNVGNNFTGSFRAPVYAPDAANPTQSLSGNGSLSLPTTGSTFTAASVLLQGAGFTMGLYSGETLLVTSTFRTGSGGANSLPAGLFATIPGFIVPNVAPGSVATLQVRVWDNTGGATYDTALVKGASAVFQTAPLGGIAPTGPVLTPDMTGWQSFSLRVVPEPSTFVLAGLGAAALVIFRRRK